MASRPPRPPVLAPPLRHRPTSTRQPRSGKAAARVAPVPGPPASGLRKGPMPQARPATSRAPLTLELQAGVGKGTGAGRWDEGPVGRDRRRGPAGGCGGRPATHGRYGFRPRRSTGHRGLPSPTVTGRAKRQGEGGTWGRTDVVISRRAKRLPSEDRPSPCLAGPPDGSWEEERRRRGRDRVEGGRVTESRWLAFTNNSASTQQTADTTPLRPDPGCLGL